MSRLTPRSPGAELAMLLLNGFNSMTDEVVVELEKRGHEGVRAVHAFALEAIDAGADSASELGRRLSVSKQAAAKTISVLQQLGYVDRGEDPADGRRKQLQVTPRGIELMVIGGALFNGLRDNWAAQIGNRQLDDLESHLLQLVNRQQQSADDLARLDENPGHGVSR